MQVFQIILFKRNLPPFDRPLVTALWNDLKAPRVRSKDGPLYEFIARRQVVTFLFIQSSIVFLDPG
jgi:hypothetical protein